MTRLLHDHGWQKHAGVSIVYTHIHIILHSNTTFIIIIINIINMLDCKIVYILLILCGNKMPTRCNR